MKTESTKTLCDAYVSWWQAPHNRETLVTELRRIRINYPKDKGYRIFLWRIPEEYGGSYYERVSCAEITRVD